LRKLLACVALVWLAASPVFCQETEPGSGDVNKEAPFGRAVELRGEVERLLKSQSNRERAWGAYLAGRHALKEQVAALLEIVADPSLGEGWEEGIVRQAALDSLIQLEAKVPADALKSLSFYYSDEKVILLSRAPEENSAALLEMFDGELAGENGPRTRWLAVGNLLAETKAQGFAAALLRGLKLEAEITVLDRETNLGYGYGYNGGGGCGCGGRWPQDFPPVGYYTLVAEARRGAIVFAPGKHPVYYLRTLHLGGCGSVGDYYASYVRDFYRVEYLVGLLDTTADELKLDERLSHTIVCKNARECRAQLADVRSRIEQAYGEMINGLVEKSLLDASEAAALPPDITFRLHDARQKKSFPLPQKLKGVKIILEGEDETETDGGAQ
jgi:hypothetical protein